MKQKGVIERIGEVVGNMATGWVMAGGDYPACDYSAGMMCGYTVDELRLIAHARDILHGQFTLDTPVSLTIPAGRYHYGVFTESALGRQPKEVKGESRRQGQTKREGASTSLSLPPP